MYQFQGICRDQQLDQHLLLHPDQIYEFDQDYRLIKDQIPVKPESNFVLETTKCQLLDPDQCSHRVRIIFDWLKKNSIVDCLFFRTSVPSCVCFFMLFVC